MNQDLQLKLQAYLDGELSGAEAAKMEDLLVENEEAQALIGELRNTSSALAGHESGVTLPENREFFWSKIEREIEREERSMQLPQKRESWSAWVHRHVMQVSTAVVVLCIVGVMALHTGVRAAEFGESTELSSDQMGAYTFHDQKAETTMVWVYAADADSQFTQPSSLASVQSK